VTDFLDEKHVEITTRLEALRPLVDEDQRLTAAAEALADIAEPDASQNGRKGPGRPRGSKNLKKTPAAKAGRKPAAKHVAGKASTAKPAGKKRGRRKGSGSLTVGAL
jgi:hypothetical protein